MSGESARVLFPERLEWFTEAAFLPTEMCV
jgi:hypothetical protein